MLPQHILEQLSRIPHHTPIKNKYYEAFNNILNKVCFIDDAFTVVPEYPLPQDVPFIDLTITYVVEVKNLPIFFLEIMLPLSNNDWQN